VSSFADAAYQGHLYTAVGFVSMRLLIPIGLVRQSVKVFAGVVDLTLFAAFSRFTADTLFRLSGA